MTDHAENRCGLEGPRPFSSRHVGSVEDDLRYIAETIGVTSPEQIIRDAIPASVLDSNEGTPPFAPRAFPLPPTKRPLALNSSRSPQETVLLVPSLGVATTARLPRR